MVQHSPVIWFSLIFCIVFASLLQKEGEEKMARLISVFSPHVVCRCLGSEYCDGQSYEAAGVVF